MSVRTLRRHDAALARLARRRADRLTPAELAEHRRLERARDHLWRALPRRIAAARKRLADLTAYADEIGLGPC